MHWKVRTKVSRMRHQQWRVEQNMKRDVARAEAVQGSALVCYHSLLRVKNLCAYHTCRHG